MMWWWEGRAVFRTRAGESELIVCKLKVGRASLGEEVEGLEGCGRCDADIINAAVGVCSSVKGSRLKLLSGHARTNKLLRHSTPGHHRHYSLIDRRRPWSAESAAAGACARNAGGCARRGTSSTASSQQQTPSRAQTTTTTCPLAHLPTCTSLPRQHQHQIAASFGRARG